MVAVSSFVRTIAAVLCLSLAFVACGDDPEPAPSGSQVSGETGSTTTTATQTGSPPEDQPPPVAEIPEVECPPDLSGCETAGGEVLYVERVDPDGDGDAHFVLLSRESITAPGISVIDVRLDLRPDPLPGPGDVMSAAGPVYEGSYGQRQIQAEVVEVEGPG